MSQRYIAISSFKYGLDARRDVLSNTPGTLASIVNAFINAGGEIEQRQSFVKDVNVYGSNTFGLQDTDSGLMTFGSDSVPNATLPTGVVYQQLLYPITVSGIVGTLSIDKCVFSCNYLGKAFVIVHWTDTGNLGSDFGTFCYYNAVPVIASYSGLVKTGTVTSLATTLANYINTFPGWNAIPNVAIIGGNLVAYNGGLVVTSPPSVHFTPVSTVNSVAGTLSETLVDQNFPGTAAQSASVAFTLNAGTHGTVTITAPATAGGSGTSQLTNGAINFDISLVQTAADIVSVINLLSGSTGYTATQNGSSITVFAPASFGAVTFNLTVVTTGDITTNAGGASTHQVLLTVTPGNKVVTVNVNRSNATGALVSLVETASVAQATGALTFSWIEVNADGTPVTALNASGIVMSATTGSTVTFSKRLGLGPTGSGDQVIGYFQCKATDAGTGQSAIKQFGVGLVTIGFN